MSAPHPQPASLADEARNFLWLIHADKPGVPIADQLRDLYAPVLDSQADTLYIDHPAHRVWISRCTTADGEPFDDAVTVETLDDVGRWSDALRLDGTVSPDGLTDADVLAR